MNEINMTKGEAESLEEFVWRLGSAKVDINNEFNPTWMELANTFNEQCNANYDESYWRKLFRKMRITMHVNEAPGSLSSDMPSEIRSTLRSFEIEHQKIRDERTAYRKDLRLAARTDDLIEKLTEAISNVAPFDPSVVPHEEPAEGDRAVYAMLSDIHYGLEFSNAVGVYSPEIAQQRVYEYANKLAHIHNETGANVLYLSLMGDLISGQIHPSIRVENRENIVRQITGVSELIADFIYLLSHVYEKIYVNAVDGNHSRMEPNLKNDIRSERLDRLIPWYCQSRLSNMPNVVFTEDNPDSSIGLFDIYGKTYVSVHGDFDVNKDTVNSVQELIGKPIDYFLSAHLHVPNMRFERVGLIQNGSVVSSGDDYTVRNRLFGRPYQVCMLINKEGVEAVYPVKL